MPPRRIEPRELPPDHPLARRLRDEPLGQVRATVEHDGVAVEARDGEPLALSLAAAGRLSLARSPKYHRPHGPSCLRGLCDGCLVRLDGTPGVMACRVPARSGMRVTSQNAFPSAGFDVFRVTDWFFPKHMDHHTLMVDFGATLNRTMQSFARRMAGLGTLPDADGAVVAHSERDVDVLVVGGGSAGTTAADALTARGLSVLVVDEEQRPGGNRRDRADDEGPFASPEAPAEFLGGASAVATYDDATLVLRDGAMVRVRARARLFANGCHDLVGTFAQNDLPGIFTARAFSRALCHGVLLGERVAVVGASAWAEPLDELLRALGVDVTWARDATVREARGRASVDGVTVVEGGAARTLRCDALVIAEEPVAAYELAGQAGAHVAWEPSRRAFAPASDDEGATAAPGVYVAGSLRQRFETHLERQADGARVALRVARDLGAPR